MPGNCELEDDSRVHQGYLTAVGAKFCSSPHDRCSCRRPIETKTANVTSMSRRPAEALEKQRDTHLFYPFLTVSFAARFEKNVS